MSAAAAQQTIEMIEREIVLAKESYVAAVAAADARANAYAATYATYDPATYDLALAAHIAAHNVVKVANTRLRTLSAELVALRPCGLAEHASSNQEARP